jgi:hypothetical protein
MSRCSQAPSSLRISDERLSWYESAGLRAYFAVRKSSMSMRSVKNIDKPSINQTIEYVIDNSGHNYSSGWRWQYENGFYEH